MKHTLDNGVLTICPEGELNSYTVGAVEKEIDALLDAKGFNSIVLDFEKLNYISSAGLRIIVRLKQEYDDISIVRVPELIYDVLTMVGFNKIAKVEKL